MDPQYIDNFDYKGYQISQQIRGSLIIDKSAPGLSRYLRRHKLGRELEKLDLYYTFYPTAYSDYPFLGCRNYRTDIKCFVDEYSRELCEY